METSIGSSWRMCPEASGDGTGETVASQGLGSADLDDHGNRIRTDPK